MELETSLPSGSDPSVTDDFAQFGPLGPTIKATVQEVLRRSVVDALTRDGKPMYPTVPGYIVFPCPDGLHVRVDYYVPEPPDDSPGPTLGCNCLYAADFTIEEKAAERPAVERRPYLLVSRRDGGV